MNQSKLSQFFSSPQGKERIRNFLVAYLLVLVTFLAIEILPLHFGTQKLPFEQLIPVVKARLPRILLIGAFAAAFISSPGKKRKEPENDSQKQ